MKTSFIDIYSRAMTMIKSPVLSRLQYNDTYSFCMIMNQYLQTAITLYNPNAMTQSRVSDIVESEDGYATFTGNGKSTTFIFGEGPEDIPVEDKPSEVPKDDVEEPKEELDNGLLVKLSNEAEIEPDEPVEEEPEDEMFPNTDSILQVMVNNELVNDYEYDEEKNAIVFDEAPADGSQIEVSWLNDGSFNSLTNEDITLLSMALCWAWAIQTQNNQLDIDRQPNDSDFKLHAEGTTLNAKIDWVKHFEEMYKRELSKADWRKMMRRTR